MAARHYPPLLVHLEELNPLDAVAGQFSQMPLGRLLSDSCISKEAIHLLEPLLLTTFVPIWGDPLIALARLCPGFVFIVASA